MSRSAYISLLKMRKVEEFNAFRRTHPEAMIDLSKLSLDGLALSGADFHDAKMCQVSLRDANLSGANLSRANLSGANLTRTNLRNADLSRADLSEADLQKANLDGASLEGANLAGVNVTGAVLPKRDIAKAVPPVRSVGQTPGAGPTTTESKPCDQCPFEDALPVACPGAEWTPSGCKKWIESEINLSGLLARIGAERKLLKSVPEDQFDEFLARNASHLILLKWMKNRARLKTKEDYLTFYAEMLFKML